MPKLPIALIATIALAAPALFQAALANTTVTDPWARATVPAQKTGGAYLTLRSPDAARVIKAASPVADSVELHTMQMNGSLMSMREVSAIPLPAGQAVKEFHVMLVGLKHPLTEGERVPLTLVVERSGGKRETVKVAVPVKALTFNANAH